jgi:hypothetical protein
MPTEVIVTQADIDDIAKKLDEFGAVLNEREKAVLLGVLGLAADGIEKAAAAAPPAPPKGASSVPSLSSGFRNAFQKGVGTRFTINPSQSESTTVKGSIGVDSTSK